LSNPTWELEVGEPDIEMTSLLSEEFAACSKVASREEVIHVGRSRRFICDKMMAPPYQLVTLFLTVIVHRFLHPPVPNK
jgi:hypothetical protein